MKIKATEQYFEVPRITSTNTNKPARQYHMLVSAWNIQNSYTLLMGVQSDTTLGKTIWRIYVKLNLLSPYDPLLCPYWREMKTYFHKKTGSSIFMAEFIETENRVVVARGVG